jgi:hypothetical protein
LAIARSDKGVMDDAAQMKQDIDSELRELERQLTTRTRSLQDRLSQVADFQKHIRVPDPIQLPHINIANGSVPNGVDKTNETDLSELQRARDQKQQQIEREILQIKDSILQQTNDKLESHQTIQRFNALLEEERKISTAAKRKAKQLEIELLELKRRLHQEMTLNTQNTDQLQSYKRKFPTLIQELESTASRAAKLESEKEDLMRRKVFCVFQIQ